MAKHTDCTVRSDVAHTVVHISTNSFYIIVNSTGSPIFSFVSIWPGLNLAHRCNTGLPLGWPPDADLLNFLSPSTLSPLTCGPTQGWHSDLSPCPSGLTEAWQQSCMHPHTLQALQPQACESQSGVPRSWSILFLTGRSRDPSDHVVSNFFFLSLITGSHTSYPTHLFVKFGVCYHSNVQTQDRELAHTQGLETEFCKTAEYTEVK